jgi:hypothetical protein
MQVEDEILTRLEKGGKGRLIISRGGGIEHIQLNSTDPWTEVDGERSSIKTKHPTLSDPAVRQAFALLVDKDSVEKHIYGRTGVAVANFINLVERKFYDGLAFHRVLPDVLSFYGSETPLELFDDSMVLEYIKENDPFETDPVKVMRGDIFCKFVHWLMKNQLIPAWKEQMHKSEMEQTRSYYGQDDFRKENDHTLPFL